MKKWVSFSLVGFALVRPLYAQGLASGAGLFANAKEVFLPLMADPREIQLAMHMVTPVSQQNHGEIMAGDYFGLYRWVLPWKDSFLQWSVAGGIFARFDLVTKQKDFEVIDFSANMPIDLRIGKWSARFMPYHISSHLGDDYIKRHGVLAEKYTLDSFKTLLGFDPNEHLRLYGGFNYIIRSQTSTRGRLSIQTGLELKSAWWARGHAQFFLASDFQAWERTAWNPTLNTRVGVRIANRPEDKQALSIYTGYGAGHMAFGQFYDRSESHWVLGVRFEIP